MVQILEPNLPQASRQPGFTPLSILRTETVLSRFPIHNLTKRGELIIHITKTDAQGNLELRWTVSYNTLYGQPRQLAYKLDTLVINKLLDALPRPLPRILKVGNLRQTGLLLDLNDSGRQQAKLKQAFHQNASAYIVAKLRYQDRDGTERLLEAGFTRYNVVFTGERLPDGTKADAIYLIFSEPYLDVLNHAPVRPLDYAYLKALTPTAQRFYEIVSYKIFAALKYKHPSATLRYTDYCLFSTQQRYTDYNQVKKQMYKVHRPHLESGYLTRVQHEAIVDYDGVPDWRLHYIPGPRAHAEYVAFMRQPGAEAAAVLTLPSDAEQGDHLDLVTPAVVSPPPPRLVGRSCAVPRAQPPGPPAVSGAETMSLASPTPAAETAEPEHPQAATLVQQFYQRFRGLTGVAPTPKELAQASELLHEHGPEAADFFLTYAHAAASATAYQPQTFMGILHYLPQALAASAARTAQTIQATTRQQEEAERAQHERYVQWRHEALARQRAALPAAELAALEAAQQARLVAEGTAPVAVRLAVRLAVDAGLEAQAGLPDFDTWRQGQPARTPEVSEAAGAV